MKLKVWYITLILILAPGILVGCGGDASTSSEGQQSSSAQDVGSSADSMSYTSAALDASYDGALPASSQLALGTIQLEDTENAVTPEQAKTLLPLWQALQGGSLQSDAETNAVLKQIEGVMTTKQLAAIAAMRLTVGDLGPWMQEQGVNLAPPSDAAGGGSGGFAPPNGMTEEERAALRATAEAGGGFPGRGEAPGGANPFGDMSEEERAAMRATAEAGGMAFPQGGDRGGAVRGQLAMLAEPVIELLAGRASE